LLSATVTNVGTLVKTLAYAYDPLGNRLSEQVGASNYTATYNALNQISTTTAPGASRTNEWDAKDRLVAVNAGNQRTEFTYDGESRMVGIRKFIDGVEVSFRRFVWCDNKICEERNAAGVVTKRFFEKGLRVETGPNAGSFYYTRDHLGSIHELIDDSSSVRARYVYDPYGRRTKLAGDLDAEFGFTGWFVTSETGMAMARFRAYDPELGRWLSRDPLRRAELQEGANLYAYVRDNPINATDPLGLCCEKETQDLQKQINLSAPYCAEQRDYADTSCQEIFADKSMNFQDAFASCKRVQNAAYINCENSQSYVAVAAFRLMECIQKGCGDAAPCKGPKLKCDDEPNFLTGATHCRVVQ
jgi:RHS repeat-associated protein